MRTVIYLLAGIVLVASAALAVAYGSNNLDPPTEAGIAQEAPDVTSDYYGSSGESREAAEDEDCDHVAIQRDSYGRPIDSCDSP